MGMAPSARPHNSQGLAKPKASRLGELRTRASKTRGGTLCSPRALQAPRQEAPEREVEGPISPQQQIVHLQFAAASAHFAQESFEFRLIGAAQRPGFGR